MTKSRIIIILTSLTFLFFCGCSSSTKNKVKNSVNSQQLTAKNDKKQNKVKKPPEVEKPQVYKVGSKGDKVKDIQDKLITYGYPVTDDGKFGVATDWAVRDFQYRHNLNMDGSVSDNTFKFLNQKPTTDTMCNSNLNPVQNPDVQAKKAYAENIANSNNLDSYTKYLIIASLKEQRVYIFNGSNKNWTLINTFQCTSGAAATPTITGHFFVQGKGRAFKSGNDIICKYYTQIQGNYLFHSILFDKNGNVVDGTLGASLSHGCMRLAVENAKYIYDNIPMGTSIWIY
ncbi:L,D-transpeptidase family protein [Clostridium hydrogenum]|uniref:L,D-transpeptidase family protein n=1 Tax=Clostridium hydrogenum TaxID=2855764 RepID=UPI001F2082F6|nr:L,D-transpeptidase family protein [Clostridium hydrogenum]